MSDVSEFDRTLAAAVDDAVRHGRLGAAEAIIQHGQRRSLRNRAVGAALGVAAIGGAASIALTAGGVARGDSTAAGTSGTSASDAGNPAPGAPATPTFTGKPTPGHLTGTGSLPAAQWPGGAKLAWSLRDLPAQPTTTSIPATQGYMSLKACAVVVGSHNVFPITSSAVWTATTNSNDVSGIESVLAFKDAGAAATFMTDAREAASQGTCTEPSQDKGEPVASVRTSTADGVSWVVKEAGALPNGAASPDVYRYVATQGDKVAVLTITALDADFPAVGGDAAVLADMVATLK